MTPSDVTAENLLRELAPQVLGAVIRRFGDFSAAEDAVQEALLAAALQWPKEGLPDNPPNPNWRPGMNERDRVIQRHSTDQPEAHEISAEMRAIADEYSDRVLIGEIFLPNDRLARWHGTPDRPQVHLPFNFALIENAWDAATLGPLIADYEASIPEWGWPNWVIGSHDAPRIAARIGEAQARVAILS